MAEEIRNASEMIQSFLRQQNHAVNIAVLRKAIPISFTVLIMALDWLASEGKLGIEMTGEPGLRRIYLKG